MQVKVMRGFALEDGKDVKPGQVIDLPDDLARQYIQQGKVVRVEDAPAQEEANKPAP
jgi:hypothetical protein